MWAHRFHEGCRSHLVPVFMAPLSFHSLHGVWEDLDRKGQSVWFQVVAVRLRPEDYLSKYRKAKIVLGILMVAQSLKPVDVLKASPKRLDTVPHDRVAVLENDRILVVTRRGHCPGKLVGVELLRDEVCHRFGIFSFRETCL